MTDQKYPFKNLVFRAGGVLGIAYVGAIKTLEDENILQNIERVAGSSAGSIVATAICYGYTAQQLQTILNKTSFSKFQDGCINPFRLFRRYGIYRGIAYLKWMQDLISGKLIKGGPNHGFGPNATFKDFHKAGCKDLFIMATDLNMQSVKEFSYRKTPTVSVAEACRASMAIPGFFPAWKFTDNKPDNHIYVDGGVLDLFPITLFDQPEFIQGDGKINHETLGFYLANKDEKQKNDNLDYGHFFRWVRDLFETGMLMQQTAFKSNPEQEARTVTINDHGISATDFKLDKGKEDKLYQSGVDDTKHWLEVWS